MMQLVHDLKRVGRWSGRGCEVIIPILLLIFILYLSGCAKSVPPPKYKLNPSPQEWYLVTVRSNRAIPEKVSVRVQYEIKNTKCIPRDYSRAIGGVTLNYPVLLHPHITRLSENELEVKVAEDKILPENYWGRGVCKWTVIAVVALYDGDPVYRRGGYKLSDPDRDSDLLGEDLRRSGWSVSGCVPTSGLAPYSCTLFGSSSNIHGDELAVKPPRSDLDYQMFWMNSKRIGK